MVHHLFSVSLASFFIIIKATCDNEPAEWLMRVKMGDGAVMSKNSIATFPITDTSAVPNECIGTNRKDFIESSPLPIVQLGNSYYYVASYFQANFFKAMQFCQDHGMDLISIETEEESDLILKHISQKYPKVEHFWTSGTDLGQEGVFVWLSTGKSLNYTRWSPPQPDNAGNKEHCVEIWKLNHERYLWNDIVCGNTYNFICELKKCNNFCVKH